MTKRDFELLHSLRLDLNFGLGIWGLSKKLIFFESFWDAPECGAERGLQTETGRAEIPAKRPHLLPKTQQLLRPHIPGVRSQVTQDFPVKNVEESEKPNVHRYTGMGQLGGK